MKWSGEANTPSCFLFAALMLAAMVVTCVMIVWAAGIGDGALALFTSGSSDEALLPGDSPRAEVTGGDPAPAFTLTDLDGNRVSLSQFAERPVVLNFWATWCAPCRAEIPHLIEAYQREGGEVVFLAISVDEPAGTVRRFAEEKGMPFPVLLDEGGRVASDYQVRAIPMTFFISRDGEIAMRYMGQMTPHRLEQGLSRIR